MKPLALVGLLFAARAASAQTPVPVPMPGEPAFAASVAGIIAGAMAKGNCGADACIFYDGIHSLAKVVLEDGKPYQLWIWRKEAAFDVGRNPSSGKPQIVSKVWSVLIEADGKLVSHYRTVPFRGSCPPGMAACKPVSYSVEPANEGGFASAEVGYQDLNLTATEIAAEVASAAARLLE